MQIKDKLLNEILENPIYFADIFLLVNPGEKVKVRPIALETQLLKKYKVAKTSLTIADYFRGKGFNENEIFENAE